MISTELDELLHLFGPCVIIFCRAHFEIEIESVLNCRDNIQDCVYLHRNKSHAAAPQPDILSFCPNDFMLGEAEVSENILGRKGQ